MKSLKSFLWAGMLFSCITAWADVPRLINFQGRLSKDTLGTPVKDSTYSILFTIYDAFTGGTNLWSETQSVVTKGGTFNVNLGSVTALPDTIFDDTTRYLAMKVGTDPEMSPRQRIVSMGYGYRVRTVDGATGGTISGDVAIQSDLTVSGNVGIGTTSPAAKLDVLNGNIRVGSQLTSAGIEFYPPTAGTPTNAGSIFGVGGSTNIAIMPVGNVGIGTTNPQVKLQVDSGIVSFTQQSAVYVDNITSFNVPTGIPTKVPYSSESYDRQNEYDPSTNYRFTAAKSGDYLVCASLIAPSSFSFWLHIFKNGVAEKGLGPSSGSTIAHGCGVIHLEANDYIEIFVGQSTGSTRTFSPYTGWDWLTINKIN